MARDRRSRRLQKQHYEARVTRAPWLALPRASTWPLTLALISSNWQEMGTLVQVVLERTRDPQDPDSPVAVAVYLLDPGCLGLKNTMGRLGTRAETTALIEQLKSRQRFAKVEPGLAVMIIRTTIEYARSLGFEPNADFASTESMLAGIEPGPRDARLHLGGPEGKPMFVSGPDDDVEAILRQLRARLGQDGFTFTVGMG
jgi:hypothetical protein